MKKAIDPDSFKQAFPDGPTRRSSRSPTSRSRDRCGRLPRLPRHDGSRRHRRHRPCIFDRRRQVWQVDCDYCCGLIETEDDLRPANGDLRRCRARISSGALMGVRDVLLRLARSAGAGTVSTIVDLTSITLLVELFHVSKRAANVPALTLGAITMFVGQKSSVFRAAGDVRKEMPPSSRACRSEASRSTRSCSISRCARACSGEVLIRRHAWASGTSCGSVTAFRCGTWSLSRVTRYLGRHLRCEHEAKHAELGARVPSGFLYGVVPLSSKKR